MKPFHHRTPWIAIAVWLTVVSAWSAEPIELLLDKQVDGSIRLYWTGGVPDYQIYGGDAPQDLLGDPERRLATVRDSEWVAVPAASDLVFYAVDSKANCFQALSDTYVESSTPASNYGSDAMLRVGDAAGTDSITSLLQFSVGAVPAGAQITGAELQLWAFASSPGPRVRIERILDPWNEPATSWNDRPSSVAGYGDRLLDGQEGWVTWDLEGLVGEWTAGEQPNLGLALVASQDNGAFASREDAAGRLPRLCVDWLDREVDPLERLRAESETPVRVEFDGLRPDAVSAEVGWNQELGDDPVVQALGFLSQYQDLYGLDDPQADLFVNRFFRSGETTHVWFGQRHGGVVVEDAQLGVHLIEGQRVLGTTGRWTRGLPPAHGAAIDGRTSENVTLNFHPGDGEIEGTTALRWLDRALGGGEAGAPRLAWRVGYRGVDPATEQGGTWTTYVDALTGDVLLSYADSESAGHYPKEKIDVETVNNTSSITCWRLPWENADDQWFNECEPNGWSDTADPLDDGDEAQELAHAAFHYYKQEFARDSWNGKGAKIRALTYVNFPNAPNAGWAKGCGMQFSPDWVTDDIFGHEFTHAVISAANTARLPYSNTTGAINESFADLLGGRLDPTPDWTMGEDLPGGFLRDLSDPVVDQVSRACSPATQCCGLSSGGDNGCVHTNSGIGNKVGFLLGAGGIHNGLLVDPISDDSWQQLYYDVLTAYLPDSPSWLNLRQAMMRATETRSIYSPYDTCQVANAWASVEVGEPDTNCDGLPDPDLTGFDGDGDGRSDARDNCINLPNPNQLDTDDDDLGDACDPDDDDDSLLDGEDNCPKVANADQDDFDDNGIGDRCQDLDGDGFLDMFDNCPREANVEQIDTDFDGDGDACDDDLDNDGVANDVDNCPYDTPGDQGDGDGDGVGNICDNCVFDANQDQLDTDGDHRGDACDLDDDGDGVADVDDNCPTVYNPRQTDNDDNGVGMYCDYLEWASLQGLREDAQAFIRFSWIDVTRPMEIPVFPCLQPEGTCPDWIDDSYEFTVEVEWSEPLQTVLLDDRGRLLDHGAGALTEETLSSEVSPAYHYLSPARELIPSSRPETFDPVQAATVRLVLFPGPNTVEGAQVEGLVRVRTTSAGSP